MTTLSAAGQVILRHQDALFGKTVMIAGEIQDDLALQLGVDSLFVHFFYYHHWLRMSALLGDSGEFGLLPNRARCQQVEVVIFFWSKNKQESYCQLLSVLCHLKPKTTILIVGENRVGIRSAETLLSPYGQITKIDTARRCSLFLLQLRDHVTFSWDDCWESYQVNDVTVRTLPGVFNKSGLDEGSALLLSALKKAQLPHHGRLLDMGCGAGVLSAVIGKENPQYELTLADVSAAALASSEATLVANGLNGEVIASDSFSSITSQFDLIVTNPPFHDGTKVQFRTTAQFINDAKKWLTPDGQLYLVANTFLPYADLLASVFQHVTVIAQTTKFKVYQVRNSPGTSRRGLQ